MKSHLFIFYLITSSTFNQEYEINIITEKDQSTKVAPLIISKIEEVDSKSNEEIVQEYKEVTQNEIAQEQENMNNDLNVTSNDGTYKFGPLCTVLCGFLGCLATVIILYFV